MGCAAKNEIMQNKKSAEELLKPIIRKFEKRKLQSSVIGKIWGGAVADMQLLSQFSKRIRFFVACYWYFQ